MHIAKTPFLLAYLFQLTCLQSFVDASVLKWNPQYATKISNYYRIKSNKNKLRVKRDLIKVEQNEADTLTEALKDLLNNSNVLNVPKASFPFPFYNGSILFEKLMNDTRMRPNMKHLNSEELWPTPNSVPKKEFDFFNSSSVALNVVEQQKQQQIQPQISQQGDKKNLVDLYQKLAADFQILQQFIAEKAKNECTKKPDDGQCKNYPDQLQINKSTMPPTVQSKNVIMLENICGINGNSTRITLLKKKISERKKEIDLPIFPCDGDMRGNVRLQINSQDD